MNGKERNAIPSKEDKIVREEKSDEGELHIDMVMLLVYCSTVRTLPWWVR